MRVIDRSFFVFFLIDLVVLPPSTYSCCRTITIDSWFLFLFRNILNGRNEETMTQQPWTHDDDDVEKWNMKRGVLCIGMCVCSSLYYVTAFMARLKPRRGRPLQFLISFLNWSNSSRHLHHEKGSCKLTRLLILYERSNRFKFTKLAAVIHTIPQIQNNQYHWHQEILSRTFAIQTLLKTTDDDDGTALDPSYWLSDPTTGSFLVPHFLSFPHSGAKGKS